MAVCDAVVESACVPGGNFDLGVSDILADVCTKGVA